MSERERSERSDTLAAYTNSLLESRNWEVKLKNLRLEIKDLEKEFNQTEENIKALQSVGQIIGEVLKQLDEERCLSPAFCYPTPPCPHTQTSGHLAIPSNILSTQSSSKPPQAPATSSAAAPRSTARS